MYNRHLLSPVRYAHDGGFDYPSTSSGQAQANQLGIAKACAKPKSLRILIRN